MRFRPFVSEAAMMEGLRRKAKKNEAAIPEGIPSGGTTGQVLKKVSNTNYDVSWQDDVQGSGGSADLKPFCVTGSASDIAAAVTQQALSTVQVSNSNYAVALNNITLTAAGTYLISYEVQVDEDGTAGGTRGRVTSYMTAGGTAIEQSYSSVYVREASGGTGLGATFLVTLTAGAVLALWTDQDGNATPDMSAERIQVSILKVS